MNSHCTSEECKSVIKELNELKYKNEIRKFEINNTEDRTKNKAVLTELINYATHEIKIFTDKIKDEIHGDEDVVANLLAWVVHYPHRKIQILLKENQEDLKNTKLFKAIDKLEDRHRSRIVIRYLNNKVDTNINCLIADVSGYKIKIVDSNNKETVLVSINDVEKFAKMLNRIFNIFFNDKKSTKVLFTDQKEISNPIYKTFVKIFEKYNQTNNFADIGKDLQINSIEDYSSKIEDYWKNQSSVIQPL